MILVDTSVWIDHLRRGKARLRLLLKQNQVLTHPFIKGELACGSIRNRAELLALLSDLPEAAQAEHEEVLNLIEAKMLYGTGIGWIDAHLLASALLSGARIWSLDRQLSRAASALGVSA